MKIESQHVKTEISTTIFRKCFTNQRISSCNHIAMPLSAMSPMLSSILASLLMFLELPWLDKKQEKSWKICLHQWVCLSRSTLGISSASKWPLLPIVSNSIIETCLVVSVIASTQFLTCSITPKVFAASRFTWLGQSLVKPIECNLCHLTNPLMYSHAIHPNVEHDSRDHFIGAEALLCKWYIGNMPSRANLWYWVEQGLLEHGGLTKCAASW